MKTLELFRSLKSDVDLVYAGDYHGDDETLPEAKRAALVRRMMFAHIDRSTDAGLADTPEPARTVAQYVMNSAIVHYGLLSRWSAFEKAGAVKAGGFKSAEKHIRAVAVAEKVFAAVDAGVDFWPAVRIFAGLHYGDTAWFDNQESLPVMRPVQVRVPLR